jgi:hypothetical protein
MSINNNTTLGNGLEEVSLGESTVVIEVEEFEAFVKVGIGTDFG